MPAANQTIARPYAKAIFEYALSQQALSEWSSFLASLVLIVQNPAVAQLLQDPFVSKVQLQTLFMAVSQQLLNENKRNLIMVLSEQGRLALLPEIAQLYEDFRAAFDRKIEVKVKTFLPLSATQQTQLTEALMKKLQREVSLSCETDESLLGGAVVQAGDLVIDGSVRNKLQRLATEIVA